MKRCINCKNYSEVNVIFDEEDIPVNRFYSCVKDVHDILNPFAEKCEKWEGIQNEIKPFQEFDTTPYPEDETVIF